MVDRLVGPLGRPRRLADRSETALKAAKESWKSPWTETASEQSAGVFRAVRCPDCGVNLPELEPRQFSFNSPSARASAAAGSGRAGSSRSELIWAIRVSILEGVILPWGVPRRLSALDILPGLAKALEFDLNTPWGELPQVSPGGCCSTASARSKVEACRKGCRWEGIVAERQRRYEKRSDSMRAQLEEYMSCGRARCAAAGGSTGILSVQVAGGNFGEVGGDVGYRCDRIFQGGRSARQAWPDAGMPGRY